MLHKVSAVTMLMITALITACARPEFNNAVSSDPNVITFDELENVQGQSAFDAIRKLRPSFLMTRGPTTLIGTTAEYATVYVDGMRYGSIDTLREIPASWIAEVRRYSVSTPGNFQPQEFGGVIAISTRKR